MFVSSTIVNPTVVWSSICLICSGSISADAGIDALVSILRVYNYFYSFLRLVG